MRVIKVKLRGKQRVSVGNERVLMEFAGAADIDGKPARVSEWEDANHCREQRSRRSRSLQSFRVFYFLISTFYFDKDIKCLDTTPFSSRFVEGEVALIIF